VEEAAVDLHADQVAILTIFLCAILRIICEL
jgi:hypothetical protein